MTSEYTNINYESEGVYLVRPYDSSGRPAGLNLTWYGTGGSASYPSNQAPLKTA